MDGDCFFRGEMAEYNEIINPEFHGRQCNSEADYCKIIHCDSFEVVLFYF